MTNNFIIRAYIYYIRKTTIGNLARYFVCEELQFDLNCYNKDLINRKGKSSTIVYKTIVEEKDCVVNYVLRNSFNNENESDHTFFVIF